MNLASEVRRIVGADPAQLHRPMSRNEGFQRPLHFAVRMNRPFVLRAPAWALKLVLPVQGPTESSAPPPVNPERRR